MPFIYAFIDPRTEEVRYIGKADDPWKRRLEHLRDTRSGKKKTHCAYWIAQLLRLELTPTQVVLEQCSELNVDERERDWIAFGRSLGWPLTNHTEGGDGGATRTGAKLTQWHIERLREANLGVPKPPEVRQRMRLAKLGKKQSWSWDPGVRQQRSDNYLKTPKYRCGDCRLTTYPAPLGRHHSATGHTGRVLSTDAQEA